MVIGVDYSIPLSFDVFNVHGYSEALLPVAYLGVYPTVWAGWVAMVTKLDFNLGQGKVMKFCIWLGNF